MAFTVEAELGELVDSSHSSIVIYLLPFYCADPLLCPCLTFFQPMSCSTGWSPITPLWCGPPWLPLQLFELFLCPSYWETSPQHCTQWHKESVQCIFQRKSQFITTTLLPGMNIINEKQHLQRAVCKNNEICQPWVWQYVFILIFT